MEKCTISAATIVGKSFFPHLSVQNRRVSQDAVADKVCPSSLEKKCRRCEPFGNV